MEIASTRQTTAPVGWLRLLVVLEALIFLLAAVQHFGLVVPLGFTTLSEPTILPAGIVEGLCGILFVVSAVGLFGRTQWARPMTLAAQSFALFGVLLGIVTLSLSLGPKTGSNAIYHLLMLLIIEPGLALAVLPEETLANRGAVFSHDLIRITGLVQIILGVVFWITDADGLIPYHALSGSVLVIGLWSLALLAGRAGVARGFVVFALLWGLFIVAFGLTQAQLLDNAYHWIIQSFHLIFGLMAIGMGEGLYARMGMRRRGRQPGDPRRPDPGDVARP